MALRVWGYKQGADGEARRNLAGRGLANAAFRQLAAGQLPGEPVFGLVLTFDCLHDMPRPDEAARAIRQCVTGDGTWLIKEIRAGETWQDNLAHPVAAMLYGNSVASCLPSGLSEPGGAGLGTLGLPPSRLEQLCRDAGFSRFRLHDAGDPANLYYEVRPLPVTSAAGCRAPRCTRRRTRGCTSARRGTCSRTAAAGGRTGS